MFSVSGIVRQRSAPGILVVDLEGCLVFANEQAQELLATHGPAGLGSGEIHEGIRALCRRVRQDGEAVMTLRSPGPACLDPQESLLPPCSLRAFPLATPGSNLPATHIMVLMERVVEKHRINLEQARQTFQLSKREAEVLNLIGLAFTNKKISEALFLSEHTVKDHIKNIMKKLGTGSRAEVVATLR
jgi:DNA-binding CsgD family transcriptional regulator